jgi:hypothetical protein
MMAFYAIAITAADHRFEDEWQLVRFYLGGQGVAVELQDQNVRFIDEADPGNRMHRTLLLTDEKRNYALVENKNAPDIPGSRVSACYQSQDGMYSIIAYTLTDPARSNVISKIMCYQKKQKDLVSAMAALHVTPAVAHVTPAVAPAPE